MGRTSDVVIDVEDALSSEGSFASTVGGQCCAGAGAGAGDQPAKDDEQVAKAREVAATERKRLKKSTSELSAGNNYATSKNVAEGLMDIALLSANANQLRFLITYNHEASTFYCSLVLVILSLVLQVLVGIVLTFKRGLKHRQRRWYIRTNEILVMGVFLITVINVLLAAFTTTDGHSN